MLSTSPSHKQSFRLGLSAFASASAFDLALDLVE
jgi:hypothetical protein